MLIKCLKSKLHNVTVTDKNVNYTGSIKIDLNFLEKANIKPYEVVLAINLNNGERFETYVIPAKRGSKTVSLQGGTARLGEVGDKLIIMSFCYVNSNQKVVPKKVFFGENNKIVKIM